MNEPARRDVDPLASLAARVDELERVSAAGDADRPLDFAESCRRASTRATATVRKWWSRPATRTAYRLDLLFTKDATGRLVSSPRRIAAWQRAMAAKWAGGTFRPIQTKTPTTDQVAGAAKEKHEHAQSTAT